MPVVGSEPIVSKGNVGEGCSDSVINCLTYSFSPPKIYLRTVASQYYMDIIINVWITFINCMTNNIDYLKLLRVI
jgi:hypothetical protein